MIKTLAIAFLTVRTAIRSRLFLSLMAILLVTIIGLPMTVKGDGTLIGQVKVLLYYTLGLTAIILGAATLWTSCGAISQEIEDRQIHLVVVKPVYRFQIWLGKWLGLLVMNTVFLCLAGSVTYALLCWNIRSSRTNEEENSILHEEILVGRRLIRPHSESVEKEARDRLKQLLEKGKIRDDASEEIAFSVIRRMLIAEKSAVAPGDSKCWVFDRLPSARNNAPITVRFRFLSSARDPKPVTGVWSVGTEQNPDIFQFTTDNCLEGTKQFSIPATILASRQSVIVKYTNSGQENSHTVVFDPESAVELLIRESGFETNLVRALLVILCYLALIAALGLSAGTLFSFPVATFAASSVLAISVMIHFFALTSSLDIAYEPHHHGIRPEAGAFRIACERIIKRVDVVIEPAMQIDSLGPLSEGLFVSWRSVGRAVLLVAGIYPGVLGLVSAFFFKRRELALPG